MATQRLAEKVSIVTGRRIDASRWREGLDTSANVANAVDMAGWTQPL